MEKRIYPSPIVEYLDWFMFLPIKKRGGMNIHVMMSILIVIKIFTHLNKYLAKVYVLKTVNFSFKIVWVITFLLTKSMQILLVLYSIL